jgi:hypothetical protein
VNGVRRRGGGPWDAPAGGGRAQTAGERSPLHQRDRHGAGKRAHQPGHEHVAEERGRLDVEPLDDDEVRRVALRDRDGNGVGHDDGADQQRRQREPMAPGEGEHKRNGEHDRTVERQRRGGGGGREAHQQVDGDRVSPGEPGDAVGGALGEAGAVGGGGERERRGQEQQHREDGLDRGEQRGAQRGAEQGERADAGDRGATVWVARDRGDRQACKYELKDKHGY